MHVKQSVWMASIAKRGTRIRSGVWTDFSALRPRFNGEWMPPNSTVEMTSKAAEEKTTMAMEEQVDVTTSGIEFFSSCFFDWTWPNFDDSVTSFSFFGAFTGFYLVLSSRSSEGSFKCARLIELDCIFFARIGPSDNEDLGWWKGGERGSTVFLSFPPPPNSARKCRHAELIPPPLPHRRPYLFCRIRSLFPLNSSV